MTNSATGSGVDYGATGGSGLQYFDGATWQSYTGGLVALNSGGKLLVRTAIVNDEVRDTGETFRLIVTNTGGTSASGTATIQDDATGDIFKNDGTTDSITVKDDDRAVTVSSPRVNEGSPYAVFEVSGAVGQLTSLTLGLGLTSPATGSGIDYSESSGSGLQFFDGVTWQAYTGGLVALNSSGKLLVRTAIVNDVTRDNGETFQLIATNTGGTSGVGTAAIQDEGTGDIFRNDGTADLEVFKDDDRPLDVTSPVVNEGSPYVFFTVTGGPGQFAKLAFSNDTATSDDYGPAVEVSTDGGASWVPYVPDSRVALNPQGQLLVRTPLKQDNSLEYSERLNLTASSTGGISTVVTAEIVDDGSGTLFKVDGSEDTSTLKDDDRPKPLPPPPVSKPPPQIAESLLVQPETSREPSTLPPPVAQANALTQVTPLAQVTPVAQATPFIPPTSAIASQLIPIRETGPVIGDILTSNLGFRTVVNENASVGLNVYRGVTDQFVDGSAPAKVTIPADAFIHSAQEAVVKVDAKQLDNTNLPDWVRFDAQTGTFDVKAPQNYKGKLDVKLTARDNDGREATVIFRIFVGEKPLREKPVEKPQGRNGLTEKLRLAVKRNPGAVKGAALPITVDGSIVVAANARMPLGALHSPPEARLTDAR